MGILKKKNPPIQRIKQAYRQAPWRLQLQSIGFYLLPLIAIVMVTIIYLNISAQAATAGLKIRDMLSQQEELQRTNANQRTHLALLTTYDNMNQRAQALGYSLINSENSTYMVIPGYQGREAIQLAPLPGEDSLGQTLSDPRFQQSLWDWLYSSFSSSNSAGSDKGGTQ